MHIRVGRKDILALCGTALSLLATLLHVIGYSTSHWMESYKQVNSRFDRIGLWTACFNYFGYDRDNLGKEYNGCHLIYSYEYKPIFDWLNPTWLLMIQILMSIGMVLNVFTCCVSVAGRFDIIIPDNRMSFAQLSNSILMFTSAALTAISISIFGVKSDGDRQWIPRPDKNFLSWSFGLTVVSGFFAVFAAMCFLFESMRLRFDAQKKQEAVDPYIEYKMKPVPPAYD